MYREQESNEHDSLRARFTTWLDLLLYREKLKYIRASQKRRNLIYLEELDEKTLFPFRVKIKTNFDRRTTVRFPLKMKN